MKTKKSGGKRANAGRPKSGVTSETLTIRIPIGLKEKFGVTTLAKSAKEHIEGRFNQ